MPTHIDSLHQTIDALIVFTDTLSSLTPKKILDDLSSFHLMQLCKDMTQYRIEIEDTISKDTAHLHTEKEMHSQEITWIEEATLLIAQLLYKKGTLSTPKRMHYLLVAKELAESINTPYTNKVNYSHARRLLCLITEEFIHQKNRSAAINKPALIAPDFFKWFVYNAQILVNPASEEFLQKNLDHFIHALIKLCLPSLSSPSRYNYIQITHYLIMLIHAQAEQNCPEALDKAAENLIKKIQLLISSELPHIINDGARIQLNKLLEKYQFCFNNDAQALRKAIPPEEVWRFGTDGITQKNGRLLFHDHTSRYYLNNYPFPENHLDLTVDDYINQVEGIELNKPDCYTHSHFLKQLHLSFLRFPTELFAKLTLRDILFINRSGVLPYELNEPGYQTGIYGAFMKLFSTTRMSQLARLLHFHNTLTTPIQVPNFSGNLKGMFRITHLLPCFNCNPGEDPTLMRNTSERGLNEYLSRKTAHQGISISPASKDAKLHCLHFEFSTELTRFDRTYPIENLHSSQLNDQQREIIKRIEHCNSPSEASFHILSAHKNRKATRLRFYFYGYYHGDDTIESRVNHLLSRFNRCISSSIHPHEKLFFIISLIQDLEQLHPFTDGNCRTLVFFLNYLLISNGFPPTILHNMNEIDGLSRQELFDSVLRGMKNTFHLAEKKTLYGYSTTGTIGFFRSRPHLSERADYLEKLSSMEESARNGMGTALRTG